MVGITEFAHADGYLGRLAGLPAVFEVIAKRHRAGIATGRVPVRRLVQATVENFDWYLSDPDNDSVPADGSGVDLAAFEAERDRVLHEVVDPALREHRDVLAAIFARTLVVPAAGPRPARRRERVAGWRDRPDSARRAAGGHAVRAYVARSRPLLAKAIPDSGIGIGAMGSGCRYPMGRTCLLPTVMIHVGATSRSLCSFERRRGPGPPARRPPRCRGRTRR